MLNVAEGRLVNIWVQTCSGWTCLSQFHPINLLIDLLIAFRVTVLGCIHSHRLQQPAGDSCCRKTLVAPGTVLDNWIKSRSYHILKPFKKNCLRINVLHTFWLAAIVWVTPTVRLIINTFSFQHQHDPIFRAFSNYDKLESVFFLSSAWLVLEFMHISFQVSSFIKTFHCNSAAAVQNALFIPSLDFLFS